MVAPKTDTPRLAPVDPPYEPEIARTLERMMGSAEIEPLKLFRTVAHNPAVLDKLRSTGSYLLNFGTLHPIDREIVILRTCARCGSVYEWGVHVAIYAEAVGLSPAHVAATLEAESDVWTSRQALLVRLVDELHDTADVSDALWQDIAREWSPEQIVDCSPSPDSIGRSPTSPTRCASRAKISHPRSSLPRCAARPRTASDRTPSAAEDARP